MSRPCLVCGNPIEPDEDIGYENDAVVCDVSAGYGSRHDLSALNFIICDGCIDVSLSSGRMTKKEFVPPPMDEEMIAAILSAGTQHGSGNVMLEILVIAFGVYSAWNLAFGEGA